LEGGVPESVGPGPQAFDPGRLEPVDVAGADLLVGDQPAAPQHLEVLGDRRPANRNDRRDLTDRGRVVSQDLDDPPPGAVAECVQDVFVSSHER